MKTETLIELQRSITQGEWQIASNDFAKWVTNSVGKAQIAKAFQPAGMSQQTFESNLDAIALVPELIAEVLTLRNALRQFAQCSNVRDIVQGDTELACAVFAARAALANDK